MSENDQTKVSRELYWEEFSIEKKIERLALLAEENVCLVNKMAEAVDCLSRHDHIDKEVFIPFIAPKGSILGNIMKNPLHRKPK